MIISLQCATANPDGQKRALVIGGGIANFTDVAATFSGIIRALKEKVSFIVINLCSTINYKKI
jgi:ATP citrate (pro-S)-lyase